GKLSRVMRRFAAVPSGIAAAGVNEALKSGLNGGVDRPMRWCVPLVDQAQILLRHHFEAIS
ncbi:MAG: hypothetical protein WBD95_23335, partial [Xanthobacteraceae bacterium]